MTEAAFWTKAQSLVLFFLFSVYFLNWELTKQNSYQGNLVSKYDQKSQKVPKSFEIFKTSSLAPLSQGPVPLLRHRRISILFVIQDLTQKWLTD